MVINPNRVQEIEKKIQFWEQIGNKEMAQKWTNFLLECNKGEQKGEQKYQSLAEAKKYLDLKTLKLDNTLWKFKLQSNKIHGKLIKSILEYNEI